MSSNEMVTAAPARSSARGGGALRSLVDGVIERWLAGAVSSSSTGRLDLMLPSGRSVVVGAGDRDLAARVALRNYGPLMKTMQRGQLGFAESYIAGELETDDLLGLFNYYMDNEPAFVAAGAGLSRSGWFDRIVHRRRANTVSGSRRNIAAHYDLGNEFYRLWLDEGMTYSSGIYRSPCATLAMAQDEKYARILHALELDPGHSVLEIGCGWGGFAEAAARCGAIVTAITISEQQHRWAKGRLARIAGPGAGEIRFEDYRATRGSYDRLASIEMIEAVGEENWRRYFQVIADRLKPGGQAVIQAITIEESLFSNYRRNPDFIQRYIFPGGMLPTLAAMQRHATASGLAFEVVETFAPSYARTLSDWRQRFIEAWPRIAALGFDERFRRMWIYYLCYCQVGFERGSIDVGLYRLRKPD